MIEARGLSMKVPGFTLDQVSFDVPDGSYTVLMGPTGCGKTSILEAICGLRRIHSGTIKLHGKDITRATPGERGIGYVPQDGALFPTMRLVEQIAFALQLRKWKADDQNKRINELADLLGIGHLLERNPIGLSGGERQRVALGRALAFRPRVLMLDEPLSALDEDTRERMIELLRTIHAREGVTALHVTHSRTEALKLATHRLTLNNGSIAQTAEDRV